MPRPGRSSTRRTGEPIGYDADHSEGVGDSSRSSRENEEMQFGRRVWGLLTMEGLPRGWRLGGFALLGTLVGGGLYIGRISHALSYLSDDPRACINCHIMEPMYVTWQHSSHGAVASCNDCHVPQDNVIRQYAFKASDGLRHSLLFTLRRERQVIEAIPASKRVIQENCIRCHTNIVDPVVPSVHTDFDRACVDCHREVPHGRVHSLSVTPNAPVPPLAPVTPRWMERAIERNEAQRRAQENRE
jgi:cytochrome c nitrite reductase small subunit